MEGWREDVVITTAWFESYGLELLGGWSIWWPPKAGYFVPGLLVRDYVLGGAWYV